jgi:hypothetical protein
MQLLELDDGQASLELSAAELARVIAFLRGCGGFRRQRRASYDLVRVLGSELILTNDWDEPSLVSRDAAGTKILRAIAGAADRGEERDTSAYRALSRG